MDLPGGSAVIDAGRVPAVNRCSIKPDRDCCQAGDRRVDDGFAPVTPAVMFLA